MNHRLLGGGGLLGHSGGALTETVLEAAGQGFHVSHTASALGASALGFLGPVDWVGERVWYFLVVCRENLCVNFARAVSRGGSATSNIKR